MPAAFAHPAPPKLSHSLLELGRFFLEMGSSAALRPMFRLLPGGDGHSVMTLPGFMGADGSTASLRRFLRRRGYNALPWGLGRNLPEQGMTDMLQALEFRRQTEEALAEKLHRESIRSGGKVSLIGWSLGGLYATGMAHRYPELIRQVITLGTPFGDPRGTSIYGFIERMYKAEVDAAQFETWISYTFDGELEVPITALYSTTDGFVGKDIACLPEHPLMESIAVMASHVGFPFNPLVLALVAERMAQPEGDWQPYRLPSCRPFLHLPATRV